MTANKYYVGKGHKTVGIGRKTYTYGRFVPWTLVRYTHGNIQSQ
jgi:hypothetical protein